MPCFQSQLGDMSAHGSAALLSPVKQHVPDHHCRDGPTLHSVGGYQVLYPYYIWIVFIKQRPAQTTKALFSNKIEFKPQKRSNYQKKLS